MNFTVKRKIELLRAFLTDLKASQAPLSILQRSPRTLESLVEDLDFKTLKVVKGMLCYEVRVRAENSFGGTLELGVGVTEGEALENFIERAGLDPVLPSWEELELRMAISGERK